MPCFVVTYVTGRNHGMCIIFSCICDFSGSFSCSIKENGFSSHRKG